MNRKVVYPIGCWGFGVLFGTLITLFLVPCLCLVLDDFQSLKQPARAHNPAH